MAMYNEGSQQMGDSMMMTMDTEQYDDSYGGEYEGHYEDPAFDTSMVAEGQDTSGAGENNTVVGTYPAKGCWERTWCFIFSLIYISP